MCVCIIVRNLPIIEVYILKILMESLERDEAKLKTSVLAIYTGKKKIANSDVTRLALRVI